MATIKSIEEKAKAYDEALVQAKKELNTCGSIDCDAARQIFRFFPELKESEDEKIRKGLISFVRGMLACHDKPNAERDEKYESWIAWLEKQGEQKPAEKIEPTPIFRIGDILKRKGKDYNFRVDRIQCGCYHCDHNHGAFFPIEEQGNWELVEQKTAWSEEDEQMLILCASSVKTRYNDGLLTCNEYEHASLWLKSLKERYTWKPSNEQMEALWDSIPENVKEISEREMLLDSLYQDLKKLREE